MQMEYNISIGEAVVRYLLMMAVIIVAIFSGMYWLAFLGLPLFLSALLGWCPLKTFLNMNKQS